MNDKTRKYLTDILFCISNIERYLGNEKVFAKFQNDIMLQDAIERNLITIGEAVNNVLKLQPEIAISNSRRIVDTRNKLTHGYDVIDNVMIWNVIIKHLPLLKKEVETLLFD